ncbi:MAG: 4-hydroxy-tetrahydrodipicolinate reductase [Verrucomicrobiales bacterium]|nr:4-hydroxy-tetrahydrodipicolinate reductase [Verrucomicrobiales bacterium]
MSTLKLLVTGCKGRMGQTVTACASEDDAVEASCGIDLGDSLEESIVKCDAVIDFTLPSFTAELIDSCTTHRKALVMGTTGHDDDLLAKIRAASETIPVVHAPNFSVGVNTLFWLTQKTTEILGPQFDLEVIEMHHRHKQDAPSGTARRLAEILAEVRNLSYDDDCRHGRHGDVGARTDTEIGVHSLRGGDVVGDHTIVYAIDGERVELTHKASSRATFANGAIRAAKWIASEGKTSGLFDMQDVLGLR